MSSTTTGSDNKRKPKQRTCLTTGQCYESLVELRPDTTFTTGSLKALAMIHTSFLQVVGGELARQEESVTRLKEPHVEQALKQVGFGDLGKQAKLLLFLDKNTTTTNNTTSMKKRTKPTKRKQGAVTAEMQAEQERLLAASKQNMVDHQQK
jgi:hypothetical protein